MGIIQDQIIEDSKKKRRFTLVDVQRYYPKGDGVQKFNSLFGLGKLDRGKNKAGETVWLSKEFIPTIGNYVDEVRPVVQHGSFFKCPEADNPGIAGWEITDTETCESTGLGEGCRLIMTCPAYARQKGLEQKGQLPSPSRDKPQ